MYTREEDLLTYLKVWFTDSESNTPLASKKNSTENSRCHSPVSMQFIDDGDDIIDMNGGGGGGGDSACIDDILVNFVDYPLLTSESLLSPAQHHTKKRVRDEQPKGDVRNHQNRQQQPVYQKRAAQQVKKNAI